MGQADLFMEYITMTCRKPRYENRVDIVSYFIVNILIG